MFKQIIATSLRQRLLVLAAALVLVVGLACCWLAWRAAWTFFRRMVLSANVAHLRPGRPVLPVVMVVLGALGLGGLGVLAAVFGQASEVAAIALVAVFGLALLLAGPGIRGRRR